jgi:hypothetical protein
MVELLLFLVVLVVVLGVLFYLGRSLTIPEPILIVIAVVVLLVVALSVAGSPDLHLHSGR